MYEINKGINKQLPLRMHLVDNIYSCISKQNKWGGKLTVTPLGPGNPITPGSPLDPPGPGGPGRPSAPAIP